MKKNKILNSILRLLLVGLLGVMWSCKATKETASSVTEPTQSVTESSLQDNFADNYLKKYSSKAITIGSSTIMINQIPSDNKIRTYNLSGYKINDLVETPKQQALLKSTKGEDTKIIEQYIYTSEKKTKIGIATRYIIEGENYTDKTSFELFDSAGNVLWGTEEIFRIPNSCILPDNDSRIGINWGLNEEGEEISKLMFYDNYGNKADSIFNIGNYSYYNNIEHYYYSKDYEYTGIEDHKRTLYYYNMKTGTSWEKVFSGNGILRFRTLSKNGENIICSTDNTIISINNKQEIFWEKPREEYFGRYYISVTGENVLRFSGSDNKYYIYNNHTGNLIVESKDKLEDNHKGSCQIANFITDSIFVIPCTSNEDNIILNFYTIEAQLFYSFNLAYNRCYSISIQKHKDNYEIYVDELLKDIISNQEIVNALNQLGNK